MTKERGARGKVKNRTHCAIWRRVSFNGSTGVLVTANPRGGGGRAQFYSGENKRRKQWGEREREPEGRKGKGREGKGEERKRKEKKKKKRKKRKSCMKNKS